jgi:hypothetical protein
MAFVIELNEGRPAKVIAETADDLRVALAINGNPTTPRAVRTGRKRKVRRGWGPEVYALAKSEGITATEARKRIAAKKRSAKPAAAKRKPK